MFRSKSSELGRKPLEVESPMRLQAAHLTHRLSLPGNLAEHPSKVFRQSLPIGNKGTHHFIDNSTNQLNHSSIQSRFAASKKRRLTSNTHPFTGSA
jgi:hypothetical protein